MTNLKSPFMDAIIKGIITLLAMKQITVNKFTKDELEVEITNLVKTLLEQEDFESYLLDLLVKDQVIEVPSPKTGLLGNPVQEKLEKIGETILGKDDSA